MVSTKYKKLHEELQSVEQRRSFLMEEDGVFPRCDLSDDENKEIKTLFKTMERLRREMREEEKMIPPITVKN